MLSSPPPTPASIPLTPGLRVFCRDAEWMVTRVEAADSVGDHNAVFCVGVDPLVEGHETVFLTQLDEIIPVDPRETELVVDDSAGFRKAKLFLEAHLRLMPNTSLNPSLDGMGAFTPMNYQKEAVHRALSQMRPRLLLADAVGLGKTIEVGMILSELMSRGRADRILVLTKKSMLSQFQSELWNRFAIPLVRLDSQGIQRMRMRIPASKNPFEVFRRIIVSLDTLKDVGRYRHFLEDIRWDVVVIDEAHNVAGASIPERNLSYRLAKLLSRRCDSMLLTTATPHNGKRETFARLISLLDPSSIPDPKLREYTASDIKPFFIMRFKEDVREEAGENFSERIVVPLSETSIAANEAEENIYRLLGHLRERGAELPSHRFHLVNWGLYKRFLSSPEACATTVRKCKETLGDREGAAPLLQSLDAIEKALKSLSIGKTSRFQVLLQTLAHLDWRGRSGDQRVLIFTESTETQKHLAAALAKQFGIKYSEKFEAQKDQVIATLHGGFPDTAQMDTVKSFATGTSPMRMLIATDVASEGVNLHHECSNVIHYDLPWSIITLIQRNGRIDRFGQTKKPKIHYLMVDTEEGLLSGDREIFERLIEKVEEINRTTRSGESVLKLYDPEKEEEYIAREGILKKDKAVLEHVVQEEDIPEANELEQALVQANAEAHEDFLAFLTGDGGGSGGKSATTGSEKDQQNTSRIRLYDNRRFFEDGYRTIAEHYAQTGRPADPLRSTDQILELFPPDDLKRRLGGTTAGSDLLFSANAIPEEAWPEDNVFRLTTDPSRVNKAIRAALQSGKPWSREMLLTEHHPILRWLTERLVMLQGRGQAPVVRTAKLPKGDLLFCFIGQVSSRAGTPLIVDAHTIEFSHGGTFRQRPLVEALKAIDFSNLSNTGAPPATLPENTVKALLASAVKASVDHMETLRLERRAKILPRLEVEEKRLMEWYGRRKAMQRELIAAGGPKSRLEREIEEMDRYVEDRKKNWKDAHYLSAPHPSTRLVLVIEGI